HEGITKMFSGKQDEPLFLSVIYVFVSKIIVYMCRVEDNDGEFLLIEAADYLPKWLNPDTSENRVFLYKGELHILPCPSKSTSVGFSKDVVPSVAQALELLYTQPEVCRASSKISLHNSHFLSIFKSNFKNDAYKHFPKSSRMTRKQFGF
uniref:Uncharacterized protein n=1 Tax=Neolamprologus brichardi TaxID=32507 RepID=A0A3Q4HB40_NEOBR